MTQWLLSLQEIPQNIFWNKEHVHLLTLRRLLKFSYNEIVEFKKKNSILIFSSMMKHKKPQEVINYQPDKQYPVVLGVLTRDFFFIFLI